MSLSRSSRSHMFLKICFLTNFAAFTGKHLCLLKETPTRALLFEYCKSFKEISFYGTPTVVAFVYRYL